MISYLCVIIGTYSLGFVEDLLSLLCIFLEAPFSFFYLSCQLFAIIFTLSRNIIKIVYTRINFEAFIIATAEKKRETAALWH